MVLIKKIEINQEKKYKVIHTREKVQTHVHTDMFSHLHTHCVLCLYEENIKRVVFYLSFFNKSTLPCPVIPYNNRPYL